MPSVGWDGRDVSGLSHEQIHRWTRDGASPEALAAARDRHLARADELRGAADRLQAAQRGVGETWVGRDADAAGARTRTLAQRMEQLAHTVGGQARGIDGMRAALVRVQAAVGPPRPPALPALGVTPVLDELRGLITGRPADGYGGFRAAAADQAAAREAYRAYLGETASAARTVDPAGPGPAPAPGAAPGPGGRTPLPAGARGAAGGVLQRAAGPPDGSGALRSSPRPPGTTGALGASGPPGPEPPVRAPASVPIAGRAVPGPVGGGAGPVPGGAVAPGGPATSGPTTGGASNSGPVTGGPAVEGPAGTPAPGGGSAAPGSVAGAGGVGGAAVGAPVPGGPGARGPGSTSGGLVVGARPLPELPGRRNGRRPGPGAGDFGPDVTAGTADGSGAAEPDADDGEQDGEEVVVPVRHVTWLVDPDPDGWGAGGRRVVPPVLGEGP